MAILMRAAEMALTVLVFGKGLRVPGLDTDAYSASMSSHADYRKFDDVLRMVVDCTVDGLRRFAHRREWRPLVRTGVRIQPVCDFRIPDPGSRTPDPGSPIPDP